MPENLEKEAVNHSFAHKTEKEATIIQIIGVTTLVAASILSAYFISEYLCSSQVNNVKEQINNYFHPQYPIGSIR